MQANMDHLTLHILPSNHKVLKSVNEKYRTEPHKLTQYDETVKQQLNDGIIEEVEIMSVMNDPNASILAYDTVFRDSSSSTKCRVVFLSNLCDRTEADSLSHPRRHSQKNIMK